MTPRHARVAVGLFVLLSAGVAANILFMQGAANGKGGMRLQSERAAQRVAAERAKRLTVDPQPSARDPAAPALINAAPPPADAAAKRAPETAKRPPDGVPGEAVDFSETSAAIQRELQTRGYQPGVPDGVAGAVTRAAIMAWEHDHGLMLTGEPTEALMKAIVLGVSAASASQITAQWQALPKERRARCEQMRRWVQQSLSALGYNPGRVTGHINEESTRAIREFEMDQNLAASGRISGPLVARLSRLTVPGRTAPIR